MKRVKDTESSLLDIVSVPERKARQNTPMCIEPIDGDPNSVQSEMQAELRRSWEAHQHMRSLEYTLDPDKDTHVKSTFVDLLAATQRKECQMRDNLFLICSDSMPTEWRTLHAANCVPTMSEVDLAKIGCEPSLLTDFNPVLSSDHIRIFHAGILY